ncbi:hypothetical protein L7G72_02835 [Xenorhabdus bovienii]|uniref:hypothetical protein n=1 Tax=Xenorhabdus bovienii TaxID=40576 RepID=UPI001EDD6184|nr:hypothetical protein [Xenorhabdus bovienii]MCG3460807.1 hypothetical protein [Xenorhabdus bovienii]
MTPITFGCSHLVFPAERVIVVCVGIQILTSTVITDVPTTVQEIELTCLAIQGASIKSLRLPSVINPA